MENIQNLPPNDVCLLFSLNLFTGGVGGLQNMMCQFQQGAAGNFGGFMGGR